MVAVPLERPELPAITAPVELPGLVVSIFGVGARTFAEVMAAEARRLGAVPSEVRVELRHAAGWAGEGLLHTHPEVLTSAIREGVRGDLVIGVGAPFAVAARSDLSIWITGGARRLALPAPLRPIAASAGLILEEARAGVARALGSTLAERVS